MKDAKQEQALVSQQHLAASLVFEGKMKEFEAACVIGLPGHVTDARANIHSAFDALLDAKECVYRWIAESYRR